jgi:catechol 2,3-dioxygenase-like lactoylglutathione lyase family enzyme
MFHRIEHTGLSVSNMERSLAFYRDVIGMDVVLQVDFSDERLGKITGLAGGKATVVHLKLGETVLELFEYREPKGRAAARELRQCDTGFVHVGFRVTEIHRHYEEMKAAGVRFFSEPVEIRPGTFVVYFEGPDKEVCEMRQVPDEE